MKAPWSSLCTYDTRRHASPQQLFLCLVIELHDRIRRETILDVFRGRKIDWDDVIQTKAESYANAVMGRRRKVDKIIECARFCERALFGQTKVSVAEGRRYSCLQGRAEMECSAAREKVRETSQVCDMTCAREDDCFKKDNRTLKQCGLEPLSDP